LIGPATAAAVAAALGVAAVLFVRREPDGHWPGIGAVVIAAAVGFSWAEIDHVPELPGLGALAACVTAAAVAARSHRLATVSDETYGVLLVVSVAGLYATVPEADRASCVLAGAAVFVAITLVLGRSLLDLPVIVVTAGFVGYLAAADGSTRPGAVVGGLACLGLFGVPDLAPALRSREATVVVHVALVATASRLAGLRDSAAEAVAIVAISLLVAAHLAALSERRARMQR
jgi:hypothetical protein